MNLAGKIRLIDQFIKKQSDATIKDYLAAVQEIEDIEKGNCNVSSKQIKRSKQYYETQYRSGNGFETATVVYKY